MNKRMAVLALPLALGIGACGDAPTTPERPAIPDGALLQRQTPPGAVGIVLDNLTRVGVPVLGQLDELVIEQAVINEIVLGRVVGGVIGLEVTGTVTGTVTGLGTELVHEQFTSTLTVTRGPGGCRLVILDLGPLNFDALGLVTLDADPVAVQGNGSGAVGSLLCALANVVNNVTRGATQAVQGILGAINRLI